MFTVSIQIQEGNPSFHLWSSEKDMRLYFVVVFPTEKGKGLDQYVNKISFGSFTLSKLKYETQLTAYSQVHWHLLWDRDEELYLLYKCLTMCLSPQEEMT